MIKNQDLKKAIDLIDGSNNILITSHTRPDGDSCGSMVALCEVLIALGKNAKTLLLSELPEWYEFLFAQKPPVLGKDLSIDDLKQGRFTEPDLVIILDTNSYSQLPKFADFLKQNKKPVLIIDHHKTSDGLGDVELVDTSAAATAIIVFDLLKHAKCQITETIAQALFVGIATDTGWFHFTNTDSRTYRVSSELIAAGANPARLYQSLYQNFSPHRFKLMTTMLNSLELHFDSRYATQHLLQSDFERTGATGKDTENLIDECQRITSVEVATLFIELPDNRIKCSLRSRGGLDVREIAQQFGGGGHTNAAGCHLPAPLEHAKQLIFDYVAEQFKQVDSK